MHITTMALVLRTVDYKETDKILTLLTQDQGKLTASARGCRKKGSTIAAGETARLTATGGGGDIIWTSSNENVATVEGGSVTGKAGGTATITAASGGETASCAVTITGTPYVSNANLSLNKTDFTFWSKDPDVTLKVKGTESPVTWDSANTSVATVSESGVVKWAGKGTTTITATVDGQVLECIVRAK